MVVHSTNVIRFSSVNVVCATFGMVLGRWPSTTRIPPEAFKFSLERLASEEPDSDVASGRRE